jgi:gamma-glutamylcysteine synthetase
MPDTNRVGIPPRPFGDVEDYIHTVCGLRPVYVLRHGRPIILKKYRTFEEYLRTGRAIGLDVQGREVSFVPERSDIELHNSCYWCNARISRYYTVENRVNDQQPPEDLLSISALTLGLVSALDEALEEVSRNDWRALRVMREIACRHGLETGAGDVRLVRLASRILSVARKGLILRGLGEEKFLEPLEKRLCDFFCPADQAAHLFKAGGIKALLETWKI